MTSPVTNVVTMHIKIRPNRALLYRSTWVPKGSDNNTHGYSRQSYVGSLPLNAGALSPHLQSKLTPDEVAFVESKICAPARQRAEEELRSAEQRERDPGWRIEEALRLLAEAADRSAAHPVASATLQSLREAASRLQTKEASPVAAATIQADPLDDALSAIRAAAQAVASGRYGKAPAEGVRTTFPYRRWAQLLEAFQGDGEGSLLRVLQEQGYVKRRGR